jgi:predicted Zn-dependent protease
MKKTGIVLLVVVGLIATTGISSARMGGYYGQQADDGNWYNQMYRWMGEHMGGFGNMMGYGQNSGAEGFCPGFGAENAQYAETEPITLEEANELMETKVDGILTSDVYQMGRWYVVFYEDAEEKTKQARVDMFTGEVYTDFYEYMSENSGVYNDRGFRGRGSMMWG